MIIKQRYFIAAVALLLTLTLILAACGGAGDQPTSATPTSVTTARLLGGEGDEEGGVEEALVTYTDAAQHFSIGYPGSWMRDTAVTTGVKFDGGDDTMQLEFGPMPAGGDLMAEAKQDEVALATAFSSFKEVGLGASTEVDGAVVLGFTAEGKSAVTGKAYAARADRYYIPLDDGRRAVLTVVGPESHYDREGVRDIALTLKVNK